MKTINIDLTPFLKPKTLNAAQISLESNKIKSENIDDEVPSKIQDKIKSPLKSNPKLNFPALDILKKYEFHIDSKNSNSIDPVLNQSLEKAKTFISTKKRNLDLEVKTNKSPSNGQIQILGSSIQKNYSLNYPEMNNYSPKTNEGNTSEEEKKLEVSPDLNCKGKNIESNFSINLSKLKKNNLKSEVKGPNHHKEFKLSINSSNQKHSHSCIKLDLQFSPTINLKSRKIDKKNLQRNKIDAPRWHILNKISKKNQMSINNENTIEDPNCTFTPEINRSSSNGKDNNILLRFSKWSQEKKEKAKKIANQIQLEEKQICTFQPLIIHPIKSPTKVINQSIDEFIQKKHCFAKLKAEKVKKISQKHYSLTKGALRYKNEEIQEEIKLIHPNYFSQPSIKNGKVLKVIKATDPKN